MPKRKFEVLLPEEVLLHGSEGLLYGYFHEETKIFNVLSCGYEPANLLSFARPVVLGELRSHQPESTSSLKGSLLGFHHNGGVRFIAEETECNVSLYSVVQDIFSRNSGILETAAMLKASVIISGCGSVGSLLALELARAGVGNFLLIDNDVLGYANICRHQCGISDVGRFKVNAVRDRILSINPEAKVESLMEIVELVPKNVFDEWCGRGALILACADNREADRYANKMSCLYKVPFVSVGLWERAFAGEIFWNVPDVSSACYFCLTGPGNKENELLSGRVSKNRRIYTTEESLEKVAFEPGISIDIAFVTNIAAKVALELLQHEKAGRRCLLNSLTQFTLVCNSNDPEVGGVMAEIFDHPLQVTRSIQINRLPGCPDCRLVDEYKN